MKTIEIITIDENEQSTSTQEPVYMVPKDADIAEYVEALQKELELEEEVE